MSVLAQSVCDRVHSQNTTPSRDSCHICATICRAKPHFIRCNGEKTARSNSCWDCNQITCRSCGIVKAVPAQKKVGFKTTSLKPSILMFSSTWFYTNYKPSQYFLVFYLTSTSQNVWLCKPCSYRRELVSKSGEWYYGKDGINVNKMINKQIIEALGKNKNPLLSLSLFNISIFHYFPLFLYSLSFTFSSPHSSSLKI